ncbi:hypothetical protein EC973_008316 [Apophysomyces ossiformis]|uniref:Ion transport domain-containing protein n=1 Tax=Apophysomyces ossiformis TaxID=679940 RepID=A0A8H7EVC9_9FUNG|nr:hypothetical protein EC973_008316 [Apophysomyces ossiformis]
MGLFRTKSAKFAKINNEEGSIADDANAIEMSMAEDLENEKTSSNDRQPASPSATMAAPSARQHLGQRADGWISLSALVNNGQRQTPLDNDPPEHDEHHHHSPEDATALDITNDLKRQLYLLLEEPSSSNAAFWINVIVSVLIVLSAVMTTIETIPAFRSKESNRVWFNLESTMVALFTFEYLLRVFAHSDSLRMLRRFILSPLSIIDFISIVPFYIELLAKRDTTYEFRFTILRLFRLLRLFKTYKYSNAIIMTIEVMVVALRRSSDALSALFFFLVTCVVLFSTLLYFAERGVWDETLETFVNPDGNPSSFDSIPAAFWFVLVTITTTGYGDMVPSTFIGKLVTFPAMMFGVLLIALPSIIVGRNFTVVWESMRRRQYYNTYVLANRTTDEDEEGWDRMDPPQAPPPPATAFVPNLDTNEEILKQLQALTTLAQQNQEAIQYIMNILAEQNKSVKPSKGKQAVVGTGTTQTRDSIDL